MSERSKRVGAERGSEDVYWFVVSRFNSGLDAVLRGVERPDGRLSLAVSSIGDLREGAPGGSWSKKNRIKVAKAFRAAARALASGRRVKRV